MKYGLTSINRLCRLNDGIVEIMEFEGWTLHPTLAWERVTEIELADFGLADIDEILEFRNMYAEGWSLTNPNAQSLLNAALEEAKFDALDSLLGHVGYVEVDDEDEEEEEEPDGLDTIRLAAMDLIRLIQERKNNE